MQNFVGKGYSEAFVENMKLIKAAFDSGCTFSVECCPDSICRACPNMDRGGLCLYQDKVERYDAAVSALLGEPRKYYSRSDISYILKPKLTAELFVEICGDCEWAQKGICSFAAMKL